MSKPIVTPAGHTVKYHRARSEYRVLSPIGAIVETYRHDPNDFQSRRAMYRMALDDAATRDEAQAVAEGRAWAMSQGRAA